MFASMPALVMLPFSGVGQMSLSCPAFRPSFHLLFKFVGGTLEVVLALCINYRLRTAYFKASSCSLAAAKCYEQALPMSSIGIPIGGTQLC